MQPTKKKLRKASRSALGMHCLRGLYTRDSTSFSGVELHNAKRWRTALFDCCLCYHGCRLIGCLCAHCLHIYHLGRVCYVGMLTGLVSQHLSNYAPRPGCFLDLEAANTLFPYSVLCHKSRVSNTLDWYRSQICNVFLVEGRPPTEQSRT